MLTVRELEAALSHSMSKGVVIVDGKEVQDVIVEEEVDFDKNPPYTTKINFIY